MTRDSDEVSRENVHFTSMCRPTNKGASCGKIVKPIGWPSRMDVVERRDTHQVKIRGRLGLENANLWTRLWASRSGAHDYAMNSGRNATNRQFMVEKDNAVKMRWIVRRPQCGNSALFLAGKCNCATTEPWCDSHCIQQAFLERGHKVA